MPDVAIGVLGIVAGYALRAAAPHVIAPVKRTFKAWSHRRAVHRYAVALYSSPLPVKSGRA